MKINNNLVSVAALSVAVFSSGSSLAGPDQLLGLQLADAPSLDLVNGAGVGASYDGSVLNLTSVPVFLTFSSGGAAEFVIGGDFTASISIDAAGAVVAPGTFSVSGTVTDTASGSTYSGVLLEGSVDDYGIADISTTDLADFALTPTGGTILSLVQNAGDGSAAAIFALEGSTYAGDFAAAWTADRAKGNIGPVPLIEPIQPHTIGYWKNHPEAWPASNLIICGDNLTQYELLSVLSTPVRGDKTISMAHQLIAASLNELGGNACPTIDDAETWLCDHGGIAGSRKQWDGGESLKNTLDNFNNGGGC